LEAELTAARENLADARKREAEANTREAASKKTMRELRAKIDQLEREIFDVQNQAAMKIPPTPARSVASPSASRKAEIEELRRQLTASAEQMRESRLQVRTLERAATTQKSAYEKLDYEEQLLEQERDDCRISNDDLMQKNTDASAAVGELRQKVLALEKSLRD